MKNQKGDLQWGCRSHRDALKVMRVEEFEVLICAAFCSAEMGGLKKIWAKTSQATMSSRVEWKTKGRFAARISIIYGWFESYESGWVWSFELCYFLFCLFKMVARKKMGD
jgi:hypothetical protein